MENTAKTAEKHNNALDEIIVVLLGVSVHLLVPGPEHSDIHIEIEYFGLGEHLLELHGLLHARDAAYARAVSLSDLLVTRTHTVQQGDPPRGTAVMTPDTAFVHHPFYVDRGEDIVVNAVTVLLLPLTTRSG